MSASEVALKSLAGLLAALAVGSASGQAANSREQEQIRRLQVCAQSCAGLVFLCRPEAAQHEASAAPLRVHASLGLDWELRVQVFKRRGPLHTGPVTLPSVPGGLASVLTPRLLRPSRFFLPRESSHAVGRLAPRSTPIPQPVPH